MLSEIPLDDTEKQIIDVLRDYPNCGLNELCYKLSGRASRPTVITRLDGLVRKRLVFRTKAERRGQRDRYALTETFVRLEEKTESLDHMWDDL